MTDFGAMLAEARSQHPEENEEQLLDRVRYRLRALGRGANSHGWLKRLFSWRGSAN